MRPHKYGAKRTEYGGQLYDSKAEAAYARELDIRKAAGDIQDWGRADTVDLIPGKRGERIDYRPDFWVIDRTHGHYRVDVKGVETPVFKLKMRLLKFRRPDYKLLIVGKDGERWL